VNFRPDHLASIARDYDDAAIRKIARAFEARRRGDKTTAWTLRRQAAACRQVARDMREGKGGAR